MATLRAELYHSLAEALAEPPDWLGLAGREWPLFEIAVRLAPQSEAARRAVEPLDRVRTEPLAARQARYAALFAGPGRPRFWLYESASLTGRILGSQTFAVEQLYRAAGLETAGAELPDHAALELAFLAHLAAAGRGGDERRFVKRHAGRWLPELGRALARSGDEVYAPIGQLLADWLDERVEQRVTGVVGQVTHHVLRITKLPLIPHSGLCSLCGFCAQVCPTRALALHETRTETALALNTALCVGCGKCERFCETGALRMHQTADGSERLQGWRVIRRSPRAVCPGCGQPTISRAELDFVAVRIGQIGRAHV